MCGIKGGESFFLLHILLLRLLDEGDKRSQHLAHPLSLYTYVPTHPPHSIVLYCAPADKAAGLLTTKITESPRKNILLTYRSLFIDWPFFRPFPPLENSVHISLTSSNSLHFVVWLKFVFFAIDQCLSEISGENCRHRSGSEAESGSRCHPQSPRREVKIRL